MQYEFGDVDMRAHMHMQEPWDQEFVNAHEKHVGGLRGQRKLFNSNMLGLSLAVQDMQKQHDEREIVLVVAGASPGIHLPVIVKQLRRSNIRNKIQIHLYDPRPLDRAVWRALSVSKDSIDTRFTKDIFQDAHAREWAARDEKKYCLVFLSDIRSDIHDKREHVSADEDKIKRDMQMQKEWVETMLPDYSMLKFHAQHGTSDKPRVSSSFSYLDGTLYKQAFTDMFSAECRLFVRKQDIKERLYSTSAIEKHMFFHNKRIRPQHFSLSATGKHLQFDEAFESHVTEKAAETLALHADEMRKDAHTSLPVQHMRFTWPVVPATRTEALLRRVQMHA
jgi:hypothetical protein